MPATETSISAAIDAFGEQLLAAGRTRDAAALFEIAHRQDPAVGRFANNLAIARYQLGDTPAAVRAFDCALRGQATAVCSP